jgi:predicted AAA+ superfamily ATPase
VRERQHPKLYWVDPGLARAAKRQLGPVAAEERGPLLEGLVLTILRAHNRDSALFDEVSYWAPAQARQTEVDFLLRRGRDFWPSKSWRGRDFRHRNWLACAPSASCGG